MLWVDGGASLNRCSTGPCAACSYRPVVPKLKHIPPLQHPHVVVTIRWEIHSQSMCHALGIISIYILLSNGLIVHSLFVSTAVPP